MLSQFVAANQPPVNLIAYSRQSREAKASTILDRGHRSPVGLID